jgi:hypothetical protein
LQVVKRLWLPRKRFFGKGASRGREGSFRNLPDIRFRGAAGGFCASGESGTCAGWIACGMTRQGFEQVGLKQVMQ